MTDTAEIYKFPGSEVREPRARSPQVEDGYTRIANELYEVVNNAHACPVNARHLRLIHALIRRTYGFNKTMDAVADTQLAADTGIPRNKINVAKHELLAMHVLKLSEDGRKIGINKVYGEWDFTARPERKAPKSKMGQNGNGVTKMVTNEVTKSGTHKRQKDTNSTDVELGAPKASRNAIDFSEFTQDVSEQTLRDFAQHRKALRKPLTQRALRTVVKLAKQCQEQVGVTADDALDVAMASGWLKVEPQWLINCGHGQTAAGTGIPACPHAEILAAWNAELGDAKGRAPALVDWNGSRAAGLLEERWAENMGACNASGTLRYDDTVSGIEWWRMAFQTLRSKQNFMGSDVDLFNLFYKETFTRAAQGKLRNQQGPTR
ncbi:MAG TPA: replication protein [Modicisalibacter sp.]|nr:replication protein [Modicisalibacter sp.]